MCSAIQTGLAVILTGLAQKLLWVLQPAAASFALHCEPQTPQSAHDNKVSMAGVRVYRCVITQNCWDSCGVYFVRSCCCYCCWKQSLHGQLCWQAVTRPFTRAVATPLLVLLKISGLPCACSGSTRIFACTYTDTPSETVETFAVSNTTMYCPSIRSPAVFPAAQAQHNVSSNIRQLLWLNSAFICGC